MKKSHLLGAVCASALILTSQSAFAVPVQWTLQGAVFSNGSEVTGSFLYDRNTNTFSSIAISLSAGTDFPAQTFDAIAPSSGNWFGAIFTTLPLSFDAVDPACDPNGSGTFNNTACGTHGFGITLSPSEMTNAGGTLALASSFIGHCGDVPCNDGSWSFNNDYRNTFVGSISSVPLPAAFWLFSSGLMGLIGIARRKKTA